VRRARPRAAAGVKGKTYKRHQTGTVKYYGLSGCMLVTRSTYREVGVRNGPTILPLDLVAGLAERTTPAMARNIAHGYAPHDIRTHCGALREAHCSPAPRATAERIGKGLAQEAHQTVLKSDRLARFWSFLSVATWPMSTFWPPLRDPSVVHTRSR
jgi:hypothetical protein